MRFPWQAREFERTCLDCGYSWRVPGVAEAISAVAEAYGHCPRCSCERYSQRPVKGRAPGHLAGGPG